MAQPGDFGFQNGIWFKYVNEDDGIRLTQPIQDYFNERYEGVRGEGANQVFVPFDDPDILSTGLVPRASVLRSLVDQGLMGESSPSTSVGGSGQTQNMTDLYRQFVNQSDARYPPVYPGTNYENSDMMKAFISWGKAGNYFTDADVANSSGSVVVEKGADGIDRTFIRQPDGTLDFVPDVKTSATRGEGKIEFDPITQRNIIRQPDGSIQFAPDQRGDATTGTDETGRRFVTQPDGTRQYLDREYTPGVVSQGGYNLLQQPTGALSQLAPLPEPAGVETVGVMKFIRTSTGELIPLDNVMNRMMENMVVTGDLEGAAAIHGWITRPSNQEYLDRALAYARSPADQLIISAIARGQGLVAPPPEETIQRIGPPSDYLTEAFNMYRDQMQMGLPEGTQTFANTLAERAQAIELEAAELALERQREENKQFVTSNELNNEAAAIANEGASIANQTAVVTATDNHTSAALNHDAADINNSIAESTLGGAGSFNISASKDDDGDQDSDQDSDQDVEEILDSRGVTFGEEVLGTTGPTGAAATIKAKEESDAAFQAAVDKYGDLFTSGGNVTKLGTADYDPEPTPAPVAAAPSLTTEEALISFGIPASQLDSYASAPDPEPEPETQSISPMLQTSSPTPVVASSPAPVPVAESPAMTTEQALASFGTPASQMGSYATNTPASPDPFARRGRAGGGMVGKREMTMVGESGPELALFPHGTEIIPLDRQMQPSQVQRLRNRGVRGMQEGGIVFDSPLPLGIRQLQAGRSLGAPRGQLLRTAGIALPSAQARRRMLPGEREAFGELGRLAGIPEAEFQQELAITDPSGAPRTTNARMLPLSLRR